MHHSLSEDLSWCVCAGRAVFLDMPRNCYFCLADADDAAFRRWAAGEPVEPVPAALQRLVERGVLVRSEKTAGTLPAYVEPATRDLAVEGAGGARMSAALRAALDQMRIQWMLRRHPIAAIVRRHHGPVAGWSGPGEALAEARRIAGVLATTALLLGKADRCLPRALVARALCARRGLASMLVFGVRMEPFAAHCWVQWGDAVIVGDLEQSRMFTPILALP